MNIKRKIFNFLQKKNPYLATILIYKKVVGEKPNLRTPRTFDEKILYLKLFWQDKLIVVCGDKYNVREYVKKKNLANILPQLYGVYNSPEEINFNKLPKRFAIKISNASHMNIVVNDKQESNYKLIVDQLKRWYVEDFGLNLVEHHYSAMNRRIIVEEYLSDKNGKFPIDFKFFCFNGKPRFVELITERTNDNQYNRHFYDLNWNKMLVTKEENSNELNPSENFQEMIQIAEVLSEDFPFVRVDLYDIDGKVVFGEMTFTPSAGMATYLTDEAQREFGAMLELPKEKKIGFKE